MGHVWWGPLTRFRGLVRLAFMILENEQSWAQNPGTRARPVAALPLPVAKASLPLTVCVCVFVYHLHADIKNMQDDSLILWFVCCWSVLYALKFYFIFFFIRPVATDPNWIQEYPGCTSPVFPLPCATYITPWVWGMQTGTWLLWAHFGFIFVGYLLFSFCI